MISSIIKQNIRRSEFLFLLSVITIFLIAFGLITYLGFQADKSRQLQILNAELDEQLHKLNALEWRAIADKSLSPELEEEKTVIKSRLNNIFAELKITNTDNEAFKKIEDLYLVYSNAIDKEFMLLKDGAFDEAIKLDEEIIDPVFTPLKETVETEEERHEALFQKNSNIIKIAIILVLISVIVALTMVFLIFRRVFIANKELMNEKEDLLRSEQHYLELIQLAPTAVYILNNNRCVFANVAGKNLVGAIKDSQLIGREFSDFIIDENYRLKEFNNCHNSDLCKGQKKLMRLNNSLIEVEVFTIPFTYQSQPCIQVIAQDVTERNQNRRQIEYLAYTDVLTSLPNRVYLSKELQTLLIKARKNNSKLAVIFLDIDQLKTINDSLGHSVGDELIKVIGQRLRKLIHEKGLIARFGGDEFCLIIPDIIHSSEAEDFASIILNSFKIPAFVGGRDFFVTCSMGISIYPDHGENEDVLIRNADTAMYCAKKDGRGKATLFTSMMNESAIYKMDLENEMRNALSRNEFFLEYQPQVSLENGYIAGFEALIRWKSKKGLIPPNEFIPIAEENGLILDIGEWVLMSACKQIKDWHSKGYPDLKVAVNISAKQFTQPNFVNLVRETLEKTKLKGCFLEIEITESTALDNINHTLQVMRRLSDLGVELVIDDFGTGYSSLSYLAKFRDISTIKLDRTFLEEATYKSMTTQALIEAIIKLSHSLGLKVVAEGVESQEELTLLKLLNCDAVQGYYFSRPQSPENCEVILQKPFDTSHNIVA